MGRRILLAGLLGGIAMFLWASLAHMVLPLGQAGIKEIPNESGVLSALNTALRGNSGFYFYPATGTTSNPTSQQRSAAMQQYQEKLATNPSGILIYHPPGAKVLTPGQVITEFLTELVEAFLVVFLLVQTRLGSYWSPVGFVLLAGILAAITTNISYWNWYGFPVSYTVAYVTTEAVAFLAMGLVVSAIVKSPALPERVAKAA